MALNAKNAKSNGPTIEPVDPGTYPGRLVHVIDLGLQPQNFQGEEKAPQQELSTTYELLDEFLKDEEGNDDPTKPRFISESFAFHNIAADRAKSTQRYLALDPKLEHDGDWEELLGTPCMITIVNKPGTGKNKGRIYNNIAAVSAMREKEAAKAPPLVNDVKFFDQANPDIEVFMELPTWIKDKIKKGLEYEGSKLAELVENYKPKEGTKKKTTPKEEVEDSIPTEETDEKGNW